MTDGLIVAAGAGFLCVFGVALLVYYIFLRLLLRAQYAVLSARIPGAIITPCSAALVTRLALRRIGEATGNSFGSTGPVYSVAAYPGHLRVLRGKSAVVVAEFGQEEISDVRVGTTSFLLADFTTLFVGIRAAGTTFNLDIHRTSGLGRRAGQLDVETHWRPHVTINSVCLLTRARPVGGTEGA